MKRDWQILEEETPEGFIPYDRDEVRQLLMDLEGVIASVGGMFTIASKRDWVGPGEKDFETTGVVVKWDSFSPGEKPRQTTPEASQNEPEEVEEPVASG